MSQLLLWDFFPLANSTPHSWERKFLEKMNVTRDKELAALWSRALTSNQAFLLLSQ